MPFAYGQVVRIRHRSNSGRSGAAMVIAIDGPAGAGKSSVARGVAKALGFRYLDSGAMYRSVALAALEQSAEPADVASQIRVEVGQRVLLDGRDVTDAIRTPEVSEAASRAAADSAVRAAMVAEQRRLLASGDWVAEGRDIGTVVAPDAEVKVYLNATVAVRTRRRQEERPDIGGDALATDMRMRDESDAARMQPAPDAERIDTTELHVDDVVERIERLVRARQPA
jgi:CMP/dCMP kinase